MFKKIVLLPLVLLVAGCSTLSSEDDLSNAVNRVNNKPTYYEVVGQKLEPDNISEAGNGVLDSTMYITANIAKEGQEAPSSSIHMVLGYFETHNLYGSAVVNNEKVKIKEYKIATSTCTDYCKAMQYFTFPVKNKDLLEGIDSDFIYELHTNSGGKKLTFSVPGGYIKALLDGYKANALPATMTTVAVTKAEKPTNSPIKMSQDLFVKASTTEKEQYTDWAFENRKSITEPLNGESKVLTMLEYWYEKADKDEKAEILTWILAQ